MKIKKWVACLICVAFLAGCASIDKTADPAIKRFDEKKQVDMTVRP
jgi:hypothetical protein